MAENPTHGGFAERVARFRHKQRRAGLRRVEVTVPADDAPLIRQAAAALREGGEAADRVREWLQPSPPVRKVRSGAELYALLRASPARDVDLDVDRGEWPMRDVDLGQ